MNRIVNSRGTHEVLVLDSKPDRFWNAKEYALRWQLHSHSQDRFVSKSDTDPTVSQIYHMTEHSIYTPAL